MNTIAILRWLSIFFAVSTLGSLYFVYSYYKAYNAKVRLVAYYRSAAQDFCRQAGGAQTHLEQHLVDRPGIVQAWIKRQVDMEKKYSVLIGQTPKEEEVYAGPIKAP